MADSAIVTCRVHVQATVCRTDFTEARIDAKAKCRGAQEPATADRVDRSPFKTSSTIGGGGGRECNIFVPILGGNGTKVAPTGDIFDQPLGQMR